MRKWISSLALGATCLFTIGLTSSSTTSADHLSVRQIGASLPGSNMLPGTGSLPQAPSFGTPRTAGSNDETADDNTWQGKMKRTFHDLGRQMRDSIHNSNRKIRSSFYENVDRTGSVKVLNDIYPDMGTIMGEREARRSYGYPPDEEAYPGENIHRGNVGYPIFKPYNPISN